MSNPKLPFEPPTPEPVSPLEVVGGVLLVAGLVVADTATGGLLTALDAIPAPATREDPPSGEPPGGRPWAGPPTDDLGNVQSTGCSAFVPYASMQLDEHGTFCGRCATAQIVAALDGASGRDFGR